MNSEIKKAVTKIVNKRGLTDCIKIHRGVTIYGTDLGEWWVSSDKSSLIFTVKDEEVKEYIRDDKIKNIL